jgi:hypothetical protein
MSAMRKPAILSAGWRAELWQAEMMVAKVCGETENDVKNEINHYAVMYEADGPVSIIVKPPRGRWRHHGGRA